jgi:transcriptional activator SPT7
MPLLDENDNLFQLWLSAVQSDSLSSNGLPGIPFGPSSFSGTSLSSTNKLHSSPIKIKCRKPFNQQQQQQPANPKSIFILCQAALFPLQISF